MTLGGGLSLRTRVLVSLGLTLAVATGLSLIASRQVTDSRLQAQGFELLTGDLEVVVQADEDERAGRLGDLRLNAQRLQVRGLGSSGPTSTVELQRTAGEVQRSMRADGVVIADTAGRLLAVSGMAPEERDLGPLDVGNAVLPVVTQSAESGVIEVIVVPIDGDLWLGAVEGIDDARAFQLRRLIGRDVALLVDGRAVASTTVGSDLVERAHSSAEHDHPDAVQLDVDGDEVLVGFATLVPPVEVAVITEPLLEGLQQRLASAQLRVFFLLLVGGLVLGYLAVQRVTRPLGQLADTARAIGLGDRDRSFVLKGGDEIAQLASTLEVMRRRLQSQVELIAQQSEALRQASQRMATARDAERRRLARDLHDGVQQQLVMLRLRLSLLDDFIGEDQRVQLGRAVEDVIDRIRETSQQLYPSILVDRGLNGALHSMAAQSLTPLSVRLEPDPLPRLDERVEAGLYFIIAEGVTNAVKHAEANSILVSLEVTDQLVELVVADDGHGFDHDRITLGGGMHNVIDRAQAMGGRASFASDASGTVLAAAVPRSPDLVSGALEVEQDSRDTPVDVVRVTQSELLEDRVGVLLHRSLGHHD